MPVLVMGRDSNFTETGLKETILATNQNHQRNVIEMGVLDISLITICGCSFDLRSDGDGFGTHKFTCGAPIVQDHEVAHRRMVLR